MFRPVQLFLCNLKGCTKSRCARRGFSLSTRHHKVKLSHAVYPEGSKLDLSQKSPIFILHGMFGSKSNWNSLAKRIASDTDRTVVTLDARNHGDSEHHQLMDYLLMRDDLLGVMDELKVERPILLGHSMGGKTVMACALSVPERVDRLIVVDTAPRDSPGTDTLNRYAHAMRDVTLPPPSTSPAQARRLVGDQLKDLVKEGGVLQFLLTNVRQSPGEGYAWRVSLDAIINNFDSLHSFPPSLSTPCTTVPTLVIGGGKSQHVSDGAQEATRALFPACTIELIPGAGHWVHSEKPVEFAKLVKEFVL